MENHIAGPGTDPTDVSILDKSAGKHDRGIGTDVAVTRQGELLGHKLDAVFDLAEVRGCRQGLGNITSSRYLTTSSGYKTRDTRCSTL